MQQFSRLLHPRGLHLLSFALFAFILNWPALTLINTGPSVSFFLFLLAIASLMIVMLFVLGGCPDDEDADQAGQSDAGREGRSHV